ncbi:glycerophosphodiester phosphodiesterase family protein [Alishewanella tabrizica]|uniref:glycerophosphodiester phosphodiesterase n=1 Tax=Alishewanella tabrizica TaxID=671278 RepID=A0ABQ2WRR2_9ALTE|nr:glycerophosphodiester phosphodiesterase family protein [Alishewanella tabrizica]GGW67341.1 glycerophosphoryl diester phosphodiesterase [Alishewanella tabrizica]
MMLFALLLSSLPLADLGPRPGYLTDLLPTGTLKTRLSQCLTQPATRHPFSIGHRGAPLQFPEHSKASYLAAIRMGAGILECDVTFTADKQLVCRHAQCDLHQTTDILLRPELAAKCTTPFSPASSEHPASASCCASDITVAEYKSLCAKMDGVNPAAITVADYVNGSPDWRTTLYAQCAAPLTHQESVALFQAHGVMMTPELKAPEVSMPYQGSYTQEHYAQQLINEYKAAGVTPDHVWPQSFHLADIRYWLKHEPEFAKQAVFLDARVEDAAYDANNPQLLTPSFAELKAEGVNIIAPPLWVLVTLENGQIVPSPYAKAAKAAGLQLITWSLERSGPLANGGGWYYQSIADVTSDNSVTLQLLDVLAKQVGVIGVFSDWPATTTFYANCML